MTKEHKLYELSKELVYQMTGKYTEDVQDSDFQIAWTYLNKAINYTHSCKSDSELLAEHKCKFYVNADWSYLKCGCGKRIKPSEG